MAKKGKSEKGTKNAPSFQDLLSTFTSEFFIGRTEHIALFEDALTSEKPKFLILGVSGQGGVGKSTLVEKFVELGRERGAISSVTSEHEETIPDVLNKFSKNLAHEVDFSIFFEKLVRYRELKEQVEADPEAPSGLLDFAIRTATKAGLKTLKRIPVAGDIAEVFIDKENEEIVANEASSLARYVSKKFSTKEDKKLLLDAIPELSRTFIECLSKTNSNKRILLFFDTFEKTSPDLEVWLQDFLSGFYGHFSKNILVILSGRHPLGESWTRFSGALKQISLEAFTLEETTRYANKSGIYNEDEISSLHRISEGVPALLAFLVSVPNEAPEDLSSNAVERFLRGSSKANKRIAIEASVPRFFDEDIVQLIQGSSASNEDFEWLIDQPFVKTGKHGWHFHEVVRTMLVRNLLHRSQRMFNDLHAKMEKYYTDQQLLHEKEGKGERSNWAKFEKEITYHKLSQDPVSGTRYAIKSLLIDAKGDASLIDTPDVRKIITEFLFLLNQVNEEIQNPHLQDWDYLSNHRGETPLQASDSDLIDLLEKCSNLPNLKASDLARIYFFQAQLVQFKTDYPKALELLTKAISLNNSVAGYFYWRSYYNYSFSLQYDRALEDIDHAISLQPTTGSFYHLKGHVLAWQKKLTESIEEYSKAIEISPNNGNDYKCRSISYRENGDFQKALADLQKAMELEPDAWSNFHQRAHVYEELEQYDQALLDYSKAIELHESSDHFRCRANLYLQLGKKHLAFNDYATSIEMDPYDVKNFLHRGEALFDEERFEEAYKDFEKAKELQPQNFFHYFWLGQTLRRLGDDKKALEEFSAGISCYDRYAPLFHERGHVHSNLGDIASSKADFLKSIELHPENGKYHTCLGGIFYKEGEFSKAEDSFNTAISLGFNYGYHRRAHLYEELSRDEAALQDFNSAVLLASDDTEVFYCRGKFYFDQHHYKLAVDDFSLFIKEEKNANSSAFFYRGLSYFHLKEFNKAKKDLQKFVKSNPESTSGKLFLGKALFQAGKKEEGTRFIFASVKEKPIELFAEVSDFFSGLGEIGQVRKLLKNLNSLDSSLLTEIKNAVKLPDIILNEIKKITKSKKVT